MGGGPRKKLGSELKARKMAANGLGAGWEQATLPGLGTKRGPGVGRAQGALTPGVLLLRTRSRSAVRAAGQCGWGARAVEGRFRPDSRSPRSSVSPRRVVPCREEGRPISVCEGTEQGAPRAQCCPGTRKVWSLPEGRGWGVRLSWGGEWGISFGAGEAPGDLEWRELCVSQPGDAVAPRPGCSFEDLSRSRK